jgi:antitoxin component YwqK of YwqJK toxin-antitoxin module
MKNQSLAVKVIFLIFNILTQKRNTLTLFQPIKVRTKLVSYKRAFYLNSKPRVFILIFGLFFSFLSFAKQEKIYYDSKWQGSLESEAEFYRICTFDSNGKPIGEIRDYFVTGELQATVEGALSIDRNDDSKSLFRGKARAYNKKGIIISETIFSEKGELKSIKQYNDIGLPIRTNYYNLKKERIATKDFFENGNAKTLFSVKNGKHGADYITYFENGTIRASRGYVVKNTADSTDQTIKEIDILSKNNISSGDTIIVTTQNHRNAKMVNDKSSAKHLDSIFPMYDKTFKTLFTGYAILIQENAYFTSKVDPANMGSVIKGIREGLWTKHNYEVTGNGTIFYGPKISEVNYINGEEVQKIPSDGLKTLLYGWTQKKSEGNYENGVKNGPWTYWRLYRKSYWVVTKANYINGKVVSSIRFNKFGMEVEKYNYADFNLDIDYGTTEINVNQDYNEKRIEYFDNGKKFSEINYENGEKNGISTKWYDSYYSGPLGNKKPHGVGNWPYTGTTHFKNTETKYVNGKKVYMHVFDENGTLTRTENFD